MIRASDKSRPLILVTGLAGAGRSSALKCLEDFGYDAIDNLPLGLMPALIAGFDADRDPAAAKPLALGIDSRAMDFAPERLCDLIRPLRRDPRFSFHLLFLEGEDEALRRRFTETRRRHPLLPDRPLIDGIAAERTLMAPLKAEADLVIDSSALSLGDLKALLGGHFAGRGKSPMAIGILSFSYRAGLPREADLVFDVRFLANPHYDPDLRALTGLEEKVGAKIAADPAFTGFFAGLTAWLPALLPFYEREGKSYLTIAIGCTGGRHRSVFVAERLAAALRQRDIAVSLSHRDLDRPAAPADRGM